MASEDVNTAISIGQAVWGVLVTAASFGGLVTWAKININSLKKENEDRKVEIKDIEKELKGLAKSEELKELKEDFLREMYALHGIERPYSGSERRKSQK